MWDLSTQTAGVLHVGPGFDVVVAVESADQEMVEVITEIFLERYPSDFE